jgi:hypothetical protein
MRFTNEQIIHVDYIFSILMIIFKERGHGGAQIKLFDE